MKYLCLIVGIVAVSVIECYAIHQGINGTVLGGALVVIAGITGYAFGHFPSKKK